MGASGEWVATLGMIPIDRVIVGDVFDGERVERVEHTRAGLALTKSVTLTLASGRQVVEHHLHLVRIAERDVDPNRLDAMRAVCRRHLPDWSEAEVDEIARKYVTACVPLLQVGLQLRGHADAQALAESARSPR